MQWNTAQKNSTNEGLGPRRLRVARGRSRLITGTTAIAIPVVKMTAMQLHTAVETAYTTREVILSRILIDMSAMPTLCGIHVSLLKRVQTSQQTEEHQPTSYAGV